MRKVTYLLAAFALATSAATMTSCVKDSESTTVEVVRTAKAKQLEALAAMQKAQGDAELIRASAEKLLMESQVKVNEAEAACKLAEAAYKLAEAELIKAETAYKESQTEGNKIANEQAKIANEQAKIALERAQLELSKLKATIEADIATLIAQAEKAKLEAERELQSLIDTYKLFDAEQTNKYLNRVIYLYSSEIANQNTLTTQLITAKHTLSLHKSNWNIYNGSEWGLEQLKVIKETEIATNKTEIAISKKAIEVLKAIPLGDMNELKVQLEKAVIDNIKYSNEFTKSFTDLSASELKAKKSINKWSADNYKRAIYYMSKNQIPTRYVSYTPGDVDNTIGSWNSENKILASYEWIFTQWKSGEKELRDGSKFGPISYEGLIEDENYGISAYRNINVDMIAYEHAVSQMQKYSASAIVRQTKLKTVWTDAQEVEKAELKKLELFISESNIDAEFVKWKKLDNDRATKEAQFMTEREKTQEVWQSSYNTYDQTRLAALAKVYANEMTWEEFYDIESEAFDKMQQARLTQGEIETKAYESYSAAFKLLEAETELLSGIYPDYVPGYIKPYLTSVKETQTALLDYYEAATWVRTSKLEYDDHKARLDVLKSADAKKAYEAALKAMLEDNKAYQVLDFDSDVAAFNSVISKDLLNDLNGIYLGYESIEDKIDALELYIAQLEQFNADASMIENKEALIAYSEKQVELIEIKIKVCKDLVSKYKAMVDEEMAKK